MAVVTSSFTWGGHNLHDEAGIPTMFADAVIFTEAIPHTIEDDLGTPKPADRFARAARLANLSMTGHAVVVCAQQPDLVMVFRRRLFKVTGRSYTRYVDGRPHVTPNRGTFVVFTTHRPTGKRVAFVGEHRINAAFPPYIRGEATFRHDAWWRHTNGTEDTIRRLRTDWTVCAGGDLNTPVDRHGYPDLFPWIHERGIYERGKSFDRLASTARITPPTLLSRKGSDHPRILATVTL